MLAGRGVCARAEYGPIASKRGLDVEPAKDRTAYPGINRPRRLTTWWWSLMSMCIKEYGGGLGIPLPGCTYFDERLSPNKSCVRLLARLFGKECRFSIEKFIVKEPLVRLNNSRERPPPKSGYTNDAKSVVSDSSRGDIILLNFISLVSQSNSVNGCASHQSN